jgi:hypothetical protein
LLLRWRRMTLRLTSVGSRADFEATNRAIALMTKLSSPGFDSTFQRLRRRQQPIPLMHFVARIGRRTQ